MLRAGFFEDFKGADTLLIWGDEGGLVRLKEFLAQLPGRMSRSPAIQEIMHVRPNLRIDFALGRNDLRVDRHGADVVVIASCSADLLVNFADKVARLAGPKQRAGHQYLEWPGGTSLMVMVSKGEYPDDFGDT